MKKKLAKEVIDVEDAVLDMLATCTTRPHELLTIEEDEAGR